jgi:type IV secretory pathway TraG/TraD family ATPase VirD4
MIFSLFTNMPMFFPWIPIIGAIIFVFSFIAYLASSSNLILSADNKTPFHQHLFRLLYTLSLSIMVVSIFVQVTNSWAIQPGRNQEVKEIMLTIVGPASIDHRRALMFGFAMLMSIVLPNLALNNALRRGGPIRGFLDRMKSVNVKRDIHGSSHFATPKEFNRRFVKQDQDGLVLYGRYHGHNRQYLAGQLWLNAEDTARGVMTVGNAGSGKSQSVILPIIFDAMRMGQSLVVADPQKELTPKITQLSIITGHKIIIHDPTDSNSPRYNISDGVKDMAVARAIATVFIRDNGPQDFWAGSAQSLLAACLMRYDSIGDILMAFTDLQKLAKDLREPNDDASVLTSEFTADVLNPTGGKTANGVLATLKNFLVAWADGGVRQNTQQNDFDAKMLVDKETPTVLILSSNEITRTSLAPYFGAVITKLLLDLNEIGAANGGPLPRCLKFILDEFPAMGNLSSVVEYANLVRKRRISFLIAFQTLSQLRETYGPTKAEVLMAGMATQIVFGGADLETAEYYSRLAGTSTEKANPQDKQTVARNLIEPNEIIQPSMGNCTIFSRYVETDYSVQAIILSRLARFYERHDIKKLYVAAKASKKTPNILKRLSETETISNNTNEIEIIEAPKLAKPLARKEELTKKIAKPLGVAGAKL